MANNPTKHNPLVAWRTKASNVRVLTRQTVDDAATYQIDVLGIDSNEVGFNTKEIGFYLTDYIGVPYRIIDVGATTIDVSDDFRTELCPTSGRNAYIHKSAYKGQSLYLPSMCFTHLHPIAASNNNKYALSILYQGQPNGRRIPFTAVSQPLIADYRANVIDEDGVVFSPIEDYGKNPQLEVYQILEDGTYSKLPTDPNITRSLVDGEIDSVLFSGTGELITGYILIKN